MADAWEVRDMATAVESLAKAQEKLRLSNHLIARTKCQLVTEKLLDRLDAMLTEAKVAPVEREH